MATRPLDAWVLELAEVVVKRGGSIAGHDGVPGGSDDEPRDASLVRQRASPGLRRFAILMRRPWRQDLLGEEQELSGIDALALPAVALSEELFELMLELGVEMNLLGERLQQLADELMGRLEVVGEWVGRADHTPYYVYE